MEVRLVTSEGELNAVAEVLLQLRPQYDLEGLIAQIKVQQQYGYQIAYVVSGEKALCVAGFVVGQKLAWGKHIYIDDLVSAEECRSAGAGSVMIGWLKEYAKELGCAQIHLDSGVQRFPAHRFYLRERFEIASHHFSMVDMG